MEIEHEHLAYVLLIDDSPAEILITESTLEHDHIHLNFDSVLGGEEALIYLKSKIHEQLPNMILLDLNMPGMDGREVLEQIKHDESLRHIPVIIYSGSDAKQDIRRTKALGATHYMTKTINLEKLRQAIACINNLTLIQKNNDIYLYQTRAE